MLNDEQYNLIVNLINHAGDYARIENAIKVVPYWEDVTQFENELERLDNEASAFWEKLNA